MNPYYEQKILNSEPIELVKMVYQTAAASVREAREHLRHKRIRERSTAIMRAYAAIAELISSLRPEVAPEMCDRLHGLYAYMQRRLLDANMQQADEPLAEVLGLLTTLAEAWEGVADELAAKARAIDDARPSTWRSPSRDRSAQPSYAVNA